MKNREKGLHVRLWEGSLQHSHIQQQQRCAYFRRKNLCVNIHDEIGGAAARKLKKSFIFVRGEMIELCDKYACVYYSKQQRQDMLHGCASVRDIFTYIKTRSPFSSPSPARAQHIWVKTKKKKEVECDFHIWKLSPPTHTHGVGGTLTQRDHHDEHVNERERDTNP
jgi:hypothetical protein